jgi:hypothetical protein
MTPKLSRVFCRVDPQIIKVIFDNNFEMQSNSTELAAWKSSELLVGRSLDKITLKTAPKSFKICDRATEIMMPDVIEKPTSYTHTHTLQRLS